MELEDPAFLSLNKASFSERKAGSSKEKSASVGEMGNLNLDASMGMEKGKEEHIGVVQGNNVKEKVWDASEEIEDNQLYIRGRGIFFLSALFRRCDHSF